MDIQVIEIIFKKMALTYGKAFVDQYRDVQMQEVMQNWAKEMLVAIQVIDEVVVNVHTQ